MPGMTLNPVAVPMRVRLSGLALAFAISFAAPAAQAQTMNFDAAACVGAGSSWYQGWVENGFQLTSSLGFGSWCSDYPGYPRSPALFIDGYNQLATLSLVDGGTFTLTSIELAAVEFGGLGGTVFFTGAVQGGGLIGTSFAFPTAIMTPTFTPFRFGPEWTGLTRVTWGQAAGFTEGLHQFDNLNGSYGTRMIELFVLEGPTGSTGPTETVPEPATMTLLASGLIGMSLARRRRKQ